MDNYSQAKLLRAQYILLSIEGSNIMKKTSIHENWKKYIHCSSRELANTRCDILVKSNSRYIKL